MNQPSIEGLINHSRMQCQACFSSKRAVQCFKNGEMPKPKRENNSEAFMSRGNEIKAHARSFKRLHSFFS